LSFPFSATPARRPYSRANAPGPTGSGDPSELINPA
jgi:hypothetical protein